MKSRSHRNQGYKIAARLLGLVGAKYRHIAIAAAARLGVDFPIGRVQRDKVVCDFVMTGGSAHPGLVIKKAASTHQTPVPNAASNDFLQSYQWRRLRYEVLREQGRRCQCCGATPESGAVMNVDHIKPRKLFPHLALEKSNLQVLCGTCNHGKGNWDSTDWRDVDQHVVIDAAGIGLMKPRLVRRA